MKRVKTRTVVAIALALLAIPQFVGAFAIREPVLAGIGVLALTFAALACFVDRWWAVVPGIVGAAIVAAHTGLFYTAYLHFDSAIEFGYVVSCLVLGVLIVTLGVVELAMRNRRETSWVSSRALGGMGFAAVAVIALISASAVVTFSSHDTVSASDRDGALVVTYKALAVTDESKQPATSSAGPVRIVIENKDLGFHNFQIEGTDIATDLAPKESKLVVADLEPGTYTFKCTISGHTKMTGTLTVQ